MEQTPNVNLFELQVDNNGTAYLKEAAKWAKFIAIIGFIFTGLIVLIALFAGSILASTFSAMGAGGLGVVSGAAISVVYILIALINFFPCLYTYNFASKMQVALRNNDQEQLNQSFKNLKSVYRFIGILIVIYLCIIALAFIIGMIGMATMHR